MSTITEGAQAAVDQAQQRLDAAQQLVREFDALDGTGILDRQLRELGRELVAACAGRLSAAQRVLSEAQGFQAVVDEHDAQVAAANAGYRRLTELLTLAVLDVKASGDFDA